MRVIGFLDPRLRCRTARTRLIETRDFGSRTFRAGLAHRVLASWMLSGCLLAAMTLARRFASLAWAPRLTVFFVRARLVR